MGAQKQGISQSFESPNPSALLAPKSSRITRESLNSPVRVKRQCLFQQNNPTAVVHGQEESQTSPLVTLQ